MSYANFKPTFWAKEIQRSLEAKCKIVNDCWTAFEGECKKGEKVKIIGLGEVTIGDYTGTLPDPETIADSSVYMDIDQAKFFNFKIDDIDKAQAREGLMEMYLEEVTDKMARVRDRHAASIALQAGGMSASTKLTTAKDAKALIDAGLLYLRENNVEIEDKVYIEIPYFMYQLFKDNLVELKTNNDELIKKGIVGMYDNCVVKYSNNLYNDGTDTYAMIRTKKGIAFASGIDQTEAYRPEKSFSDAIKGLNTFGAKSVRPKELYAIKVHK